MKEIKQTRHGIVCNVRVLVILVTLFPALTFAQSGKFVLSFENMFHAEPLEFNKEYTNAHGENLRFTLLNYFVSNITLTRTDGSVYAVPQDSCYFLIKHTPPETHRIELKVPEGKYSSVTFLIGVDSLRSTQGPEKRQGVLDVGAGARGMYWQWNSGYIFFKMEGKSKSLPDSTKNGFYYHIGGYGGFDSKTLNCIRYKTLAFDKLKVSKNKTPVVNITFDAAKFFSAQTPIKVTEKRSIMGGPVSVKIADNYTDIFSVSSVAYTRNRK